MGVAWMSVDLNITLGFYLKRLLTGVAWKSVDRNITALEVSPMNVTLGFYLEHLSIGAAWKSLDLNMTALEAPHCMLSRQAKNDIETENVDCQHSQ